MLRDNLSIVEVVKREDARWLALHDRAMVVGHGEIVDINKETVKVALIIRKGEKNV